MQPQAGAQQQAAGGATTPVASSINTVWIDQLSETTSYCEHILAEASANRWCLSSPPLICVCTSADGDDSALKNGISILPETKVVAVDLEGVDLSRTGEATIVSVATEKGVYLFDIVCLGAEGVAILGRLILHNPTVLKVLFDCRQDCDSLYHQFSHQVIHPICDLQVSCICYLFKKDRRDRLIGMGKCFRDRLKVWSDAELQVKATVGPKTFGDKGGDSELWKRRPIDPDLVAYSAIDVKHMFSALDVIHNNVDGNSWCTRALELGITVGCARRDRTVQSKEEVPHSADCDFEDLLAELGEAPQRLHQGGGSIPLGRTLHPRDNNNNNNNNGGNEPAPILMPKDHLQVALCKTKLCYAYRSGRCDKGDTCTYAHGDGELRPSPNIRANPYQGVPLRHQGPTTYSHNTGGLHAFQHPQLQHQQQQPYQYQYPPGMPGQQWAVPPQQHQQQYHQAQHNQAYNPGPGGFGQQYQRGLMQQQQVQYMQSSAPPQFGQQPVAGGMNRATTESTPGVPNQVVPPQPVGPSTRRQ